MRKIILNIHMYGGLLACGYLIVLGISSLQFSHHFFPDTPGKTTWERDIAPLNATAAVAAGEQARSELGLFGWVNARTAKLKNGDLTFTIDRPGRQYAIAVSAAGHAKVDEQRRTPFIMTALHGMESVPGSKLMSVWGVYTEFASFFGIGACLSGIYLFASTKRDRKAALIVLAISTVLAVGGMTFFYFNG